MTRTRQLIRLSLLSALSACDGLIAAPAAPTESSNDRAEGAPEEGGPTGTGVPPRGGAGTEAADAGPSLDGTGLPCEVAELLSQSCAGCHGSPPSAGAPMAMLTREDLALAAVSDGSKTVAELCVARMRDAQQPMPPGNTRVDDARIDAFERWVLAGMPASECGTLPLDPFATPVVCTSDAYWTRDDDGSTRMHPGRACLDCHAREDGPRFSLAGTVFPSAHEPDDCNGASGQIVIEVIDAAGKITRVSANEVGNFYANARLAMPITARVLYQGRVREMTTPQRSADCNGCHSESGQNGAPGRIMLP